MTRASHRDPFRPPPEFLRDMVCAGCGAVPQHVARSKVEHRLIHVGTVHNAGEMVTICGGEVVPAGQEWRAALEPGIVVVATSTGRDLYSHRVRLGKRANSSSGSWTGTALCGATPYGNALWNPASPDHEPSAPCLNCEDANARRNPKELHDETS